MAGELFDLAVEMIGGGLAEKMGQELADRLAGAAARGCGDPTRTCGSWRPSWVTTGGRGGAGTGTGRRRVSPGFTANGTNVVFRTLFRCEQSMSWRSTR